MTPTYHVGQRVSFLSEICTVRYVGPVEGTNNEWLGVEWDDPTRGKHNGELNGKRYFDCLSMSRTAASFVRPNRQADPFQNFVQAVQQKYAGDTAAQPSATDFSKQHIISGKVVEEVGFEKIRRQLAQLQELRVVIVDGLRINAAEAPDMTIRDVCPKIVELDLSRNLFEHFHQISDICGELDYLQTLRINGNRFTANINDPVSYQKKLRGIRNLEMDDVLLPWVLAAAIASHFESLVSLTLSSNHFASISKPLLASNLVSLTLDYNQIQFLSDLQPLTQSVNLETLQLKGNRISASVRVGFSGSLAFGQKLRYVDLSYNCIAEWGFVDRLPSVFPGLESLRLSHNPIYQSIEEEPVQARDTEMNYMLTIARLGQLKTLNFSNITSADRTNAELYYLSSIGNAMAAVPESQEYAITSQHKRFSELCEVYGPPVILRKSAESINPNFLEARLIKFRFYKVLHSNTEFPVSIVREREISKVFNVYRVKGIVGREFGISPLRLRLIWETGQRDPVAGYEDLTESVEEVEIGNHMNVKSSPIGYKEQWMKREVEIEDGTRHIGLWIDGMEATIRVEELENP